MASADRRGGRRGAKKAAETAKEAAGRAKSGGNGQATDAAHRERETDQMSKAATATAEERVAPGTGPAKNTSTTSAQTTTGAQTTVGAQTAAVPRSVDAAFGQAVWLMMNTPAFKHCFLTDLEWMVLPPILLGQYRITYDGGKPVAFVAWATVSEAVEARLHEVNPRLAPADWRSGDRIWLISMIAPFGHGEKALEDVTVNALAGKSFKFHRRFPDGRNVVETVG